jgi:hypothetical protein
MANTEGVKRKKSKTHASLSYNCGIKFGKVQL